MDGLMLFLHFLENAMYQEPDPSRPPVKVASVSMLNMGADPKELVVNLRGLAADLMRSADEIEQVQLPLFGGYPTPN